MTPDQLRALRDKHSLSQAKLAEAIGAKQSDVSAWERGRAEIDDITAKQILDVLGEVPESLAATEESDSSLLDAALAYVKAMGIFSDAEIAILHDVASDVSWDGITEKHGDTAKEKYDECAKRLLRRGVVWPPPTGKNSSVLAEELAKIHIRCLAFPAATAATAIVTIASLLDQGGNYEAADALRSLLYVGTTIKCRPVTVGHDIASRLPKGLTYRDLVGVYVMPS